MKYQSQFQSYDIVEVISDDPALRAIKGKKGIVQGMSQSEEDPSIFAYAVYMPASKINWFILETDLKATGKTANPEQLESDTVISINSRDEDDS
ncbi:MAG: hypothetical protein ACHP65_05380 [Legionellales bacterium]